MLYNEPVASTACWTGRQVLDTPHRCVRSGGFIANQIYSAEHETVSFFFRLPNWTDLVKNAHVIIWLDDGEDMHNISINISWYFRFYNIILLWFMKFYKNNIQTYIFIRGYSKMHCALIIIVNNYNTTYLPLSIWYTSFLNFDLLLRHSVPYILWCELY